MNPIFLIFAPTYEAVSYSQIVNAYGLPPQWCMKATFEHICGLHSTNFIELSCRWDNDYSEYLLRQVNKLRPELYLNLPVKVRKYLEARFHNNINIV